MKILYFSSHPNLNLESPAGYGSHMRGTIDAMRALGYEVKLLIEGGTEISNESTSAKSKWDVIKKWIPNVLKQSIKDFRLLRLDKIQCKNLSKEIQLFAPDIIYERSAYLMTAGVKAAKLAGVPHFLEVNAPFIQEKKEMEGFSFLLKKAVKREQLKAEQTSKLIVVSSALKHHFFKKYQIPAKKVKVIPNGINMEDWNVENKQVDSLREKWGVNPTDYVVGFVGSVLPHHGVERLVRSFAKVKKDNWQLLIVGDGGPLPEVKALTLQLGIRSQVIFTGNVLFEEVKNYMALFSVAVMPKSNWYGSPVKIFEYGAMKLPVIAPNEKPVVDVMNEGEDGILIDSADELSTALLQLNEKPELVDKLRSNWHRKVVGNYTWIKLTKDVLNDPINC